MNGLSHPNVVQLIGVCAQFRQDKPQSFYFGCVINRVMFMIEYISSAQMSVAATSHTELPCFACGFLRNFTISCAHLQDCFGAVQRQSAKGHAEKALFVRGAHGHGPRIRPWHLLRALYGYSSTVMISLLSTPRRPTSTSLTALTLVTRGAASGLEFSEYLADKRGAYQDCRFRLCSKS